MGRKEKEGRKEERNTEGEIKGEETEVNLWID